MSAPDLIETDSTVILGKARQLLVLEAVWEIADLCNALRDAVPPVAETGGLVVRGLSIRMYDLAAAVMCALGDAADDTAAIAERVKIALPSREGDA